MKKWIKVIIIIAIIVMVFILGVEVVYNWITQGVDCCSCCSDAEEICIDACCECNYDTFEKLVYILIH